uniref:Chemokine interleukin-8-like domain-containing protein n=1 Tax=Pygocentrus nattereri TaxID=42514 RepID=A0AAR2IS61_PYGNA
MSGFDVRTRLFNPEQSGFNMCSRPTRPPDPPQCCSNFVTFTIPQEEIIDTVKTPSSCPEQGYMITTPQGKLCKEEDVLAFPNHTLLFNGVVDDNNNH